jgi:hypothetical protein
MGDADFCEAQVSATAQLLGLPACSYGQEYEVVCYQPGTSSWVTLTVCAPCCATLRSGGWKIRRARSLVAGTTQAGTAAHG